ncbi:MAG: immunoglobulin-like domain-containing protein, partial [Bacilli bacterium]|nr:immunoglobulin-like domain-containing protein [Bacilli bacterium]
MKKFFALIIAFFMLFAFVGCDNSTEFDFELRFNKIFEDVDVDNVTSDLKLPTSIGSLTIVWESSNTDVLSNDGKIFNTTGEVISVTLTAHMQHEKEKADLSKDLKIAPTGGIKDILEGETGTYKIKGTVVAINARSFIISDGTNGILVFKGGSWACDVEIGEVLELRGETTKYPTSLTEGVGVQFGQDAVYTRVSTGTYTYPAAKELKAADVENYAKEKIIKPEYVKLTGKLSVSDKGDGKVYYNLVIDGTKIKGSLAYPTNSEELKALDGKNVEVYGYIVYGTGSTSVNFLNIVSTEVKEVGGSSVVEPDPETKKISDILAAEDGSYTAEGTVIATYARGFLIDDTTGKILVFLGQEFDGSIKVGDTVKVQGSTSLYGLMKQFGLDTTVEKTGEGQVTQPTATEIDGAKLDEFADLTEAQVQYVKMTGKLTVSGNYFNLEVSGASKVTGSITYPQEQEALKALAGKNIEVTGYFIGVTGSSKKYANIMVTEFKEVGGGSVVEPEPEPEPITGDVVLDFVKNFGTYAGSWSTSYEPKTITGKDLGLNNSIKVVISIANKQKD